MGFFESIVTIVFLVIVVLLIGYTAFAQVRPTHRCIVERLGKYLRFQATGFVVVIPLIDRIHLIDITERMVTCHPQEVITGDNLNARVSAQVYYKIKSDEESVKNSQYNVADVNGQIVALAQTTLRNIIGGNNLKDANSKRGELNKQLQETISIETKNWGIEVVRTEITEISAPKDVQEAMNEVVKAESTKRAAIDYATAKETEADGRKRAAIKDAEGKAKSITIEADAKAEAIKTVNAAAKETFTDAAVTLKKLEVAEQVFKGNSKIIVPANADVTALISDLAGTEKILPLPQNKEGR